MSVRNAGFLSSPLALAAFATKTEKANLLRPLNQLKAPADLQPLSVLKSPVAALENVPSCGSRKQLNEVADAPKAAGQSALASFDATALAPLAQGSKNSSNSGRNLAGLDPVQQPKRPIAVKPLRANISEAREDVDEAKADKNVPVEQDHEYKAVELPSRTEERDTEPTTIKPDAKGTNDDDSSDESMSAFACMDSSDDEDVRIEEKQATVSIDDLYDKETERSIAPVKAEKRFDRIFVPRTSKVDLFHAIIAEDVTLLTGILSKATPDGILQVRDQDRRTMYHYAALSPSPSIQAVVFQFISCYYDQESAEQVQTIETKQKRLQSWQHQDRDQGSHAMPPGVKQLHQETKDRATKAYVAAIEARDSSDRSFLHYCAKNRQSCALRTSRTLAHVLKRSARPLVYEDKHGHSPLQYAAIAGNVAEIEWWFHELDIGRVLSGADVDKLADVIQPGRVQQVLQRLLESSDLSKLGKREAASRAFPDANEHLGLSAQFLVRQNQAAESPKCPSSRMRSPLHSACIFGNESAAVDLLKQGFAVNSQDADGWTPLHHCAAHATPTHVKIAEHLLLAQARVNIRTLQGRTPLHILAMKSPNEKTVTLERLKSKSNAPDILLANLLIENESNLDSVDEDTNTPLLLAVKAANLAMALLLLQSGCDPMATDKSGNCTLHLAASRGLEEMGRFLAWWDAEHLMWRYHKDGQGRRAKSLATSDTISEALDNLWYGARLNDPDMVHRHLQSAKSSSPKRILTLERLRVQDTTLFSGRTALHLAVSGFISPHQPLRNLKGEERIRSTIRVISRLIQAGASPSYQDKWGITPLMLAATCDTHLVLEAMLGQCKAADLVTKDDAGNTALHYSYAFRTAKISSLLEDMMDDTEIENSLGQTPLMATGLRHKIFPKSSRDFANKKWPAQLATRILKSRK